LYCTHYWWLGIRYHEYGTLQAAMKLILYIVLVTVAALATSSLDAVPDPPAVNPHGLDAKIAGVRELPNAADEPSLRFAGACLAPQLSRRLSGLTETGGPNRPSEELAVVACAADPSPPYSL
jgi:hypothetical protein